MTRPANEYVKAARDHVRADEDRAVLEAFATLIGADRKTGRVSDELDQARSERAAAIDALRALDPPVSYGRIAKVLGVTEHAVVTTHRRHFGNLDVA